MGQLRALIVGIDAYRVKPLYGCVNDAASVRRLLIERAGLPAEGIRFLASPGRDAGGPAAAEGAEGPATLANLREALAELAGRARPGDSVFLYYSGHGVRVPFSHPDGHTFHREALAPVDLDAAPGRLLFDHELNQLLAGIAGSVTCIFDCCHSGGVARDLWQRTRGLEPYRDLGLPSPLRDPPAGAPDAGAPRSLDDHRLIYACLANELAVETQGDDGLPHGVLTSAFLDALAQLPVDELGTVRWSRIWQAVCAGVAERNPWQHPWMSGNRSSPVLFDAPERGGHGPSRERRSASPGDLGLSLRRTGDLYKIDAGTLADVTESALIAVYGEEPERFPPLGSGEDLAARRGHLRVTSAQLGSAFAELRGEPFELPAGARGRVVGLGEAPRLRCAIVPPDEAIAAPVRESPLIELVEAAQAQVRLEQVEGRWLLTDDIHDPAGALIEVLPVYLRRVRDLLEHYYRYALPLRMAASATDLSGALRLTVLACPRRLSPAEAPEAKLPEAPTRGGSRYDLPSGSRVCFRVHNTSTERLRVTLVNSASSGKVQILGEEALDPSAAYTFWGDNVLGKPFVMSVQKDHRQGIDRLTAIGTTALHTDLAHLQVRRTFSDAMGRLRDISTEDDDPDYQPIERWTATQAILRTYAE